MHGGSFVPSLALTDVSAGMLRVAMQKAAAQLEQRIVAAFTPDCGVR